MAPQTSQFTDDAKASHETHKKYLRELTLQPADVVRGIAEDQLSRLDEALKKSPFYSRTFQSNYEQITEDMEQAKSQIASGDALKDKPDDASRIERRRWYSRAYSSAYGAAENLARNLGDEDALVLLADSGIRFAGLVADKTSQAVEKAVDKAGQVVGKVADRATEELEKAGGTVKTVLYIVAGGAAVAGIGYAASRARNRAQRRRR